MLRENSYHSEILPYIRGGKGEGNHPKSIIYFPMTTEYKRYLESNEWKEKRSEFLLYCKHLGRLFCWVCGEKNKSKFNVHHITYKNIFREEMTDLTLLCNDCHTKFHEEPVYEDVDIKKIIQSAQASLAAFNGIRRGNFETGNELISAWTEHCVSRNKPFFPFYIEYLKENKDEVERIKLKARKMVDKGIERMVNKHGVFKANRLLKKKHG